MTRRMLLLLALLWTTACGTSPAEPSSTPTQEVSIGLLDTEHATGAERTYLASDLDTSALRDTLLDQVQVTDFDGAQQFIVLRVEDGKSEFYPVAMPALTDADGHEKLLGLVAPLEASLDILPLQESVPFAISRGGLNFECTTECGAGSCCTCFGVLDCIKLVISGECRGGTLGCGGDGCMCDWHALRF